MNYSSEETLRIELPWNTDNGTDKEFSVIEKCDASHIKSLIIQQVDYNSYEYFSNFHLVIIPETISRFIAVETIKMDACIEKLPLALSRLNNLRLLDLTGCYNLLSIPDEILEMKDLKIKIGAIISSASEVVFIKVPETGITSDVFSKIRSANAKKIEQLIIRQMPRGNDDPFEVPDEIKDFTELTIFTITGNVSSLPSWIGNMRALRSLTVSYSRLLKSLPESIGNISTLTSLDLSRCSKLNYFPESSTLNECETQALPV